MKLILHEQQINDATQIIRYYGKVDEMFVNSQKLYTTKMWNMKGLKGYIHPLDWLDHQ